MAAYSGRAKTRPHTATWPAGELTVMPRCSSLGSGPVAPVPPAQSRTATTTEARTRQHKSIGFELAFFMTAEIIALPGPPCPYLAPQGRQPVEKAPGPKVPGPLASSKGTSHGATFALPGALEALGKAVAAAKE